jgi:hypothetical protein
MPNPGIAIAGGSYAGIKNIRTPLLRQADSLVVAGLPKLMRCSAQKDMRTLRISDSIGPHYAAGIA